MSKSKPDTRLPEMQAEDDPGEFDSMPNPNDDSGANRRSQAPLWKTTPRGHELDEAISALQKAVRRGRPLEAIYWGHEVWEKFPAYFWRRMMIIVSEDCAADPMTAVMVGQLAWNAQLASVMAGLDVDMLRKDEAIRNAIQQQFAILKATLAPMTVDRSDRAIELDDEDEDDAP